MIRTSSQPAADLPCVSATGNPPGGYEWILFDLGGTLFDDLPSHFSEHNQRQTLRELGVACADSTAVQPAYALARRRLDALLLGRRSYLHSELVGRHFLGGMDELGLLSTECAAQLAAVDDELQREVLGPVLCAAVDRYYERQAAAVVNNVRLKPECHAVLARLGKHARLAVVSNNACAYLQPLVRRYQLQQFFSAALSSDELGVCKPHRDIFTAAFARLGIATRRVLYVGDSYSHDVLGARAVPLDVALLDSSPDYQSLRDATLVVPTLAQLPTALGY